VWAASSVSPVIGTHSVVAVRFGEAPTMVNSVWEAAEQWGNAWAWTLGFVRWELKIKELERGVYMPWSQRGVGDPPPADSTLKT
jgi:hypothetical protein